MSNAPATRPDADMAMTADAVEAFLDIYLGDPARMIPERLRAAMRHGALAGGKRLRPHLLRSAAAIFDVAPEATIAAGAALEMVHCYSLIHDDLPDMDNDRLRRGKPTVWAAFDAATAILAGDTLQTEAFRLLADSMTHADPAVRLRLIATLAAGAGATGMAGGQMLDIEGEAKTLTLEQSLAISSMKTGALIRAAIEMGAILGEADSTQFAALSEAGRHAGLAFQLADDILDVTASTAVLGKTAGKDVAQKKSTIIAIKGLDAARRMLAEATAKALSALDGFGDEAGPLRSAIAYLASRES
jgi:farnesyl diphosphate synthase